MREVGRSACVYDAHGSCLSGSGPTVLAFAPEDRAAAIARAMQAAFEERGIEAPAWALDVDLAGARVEPPGEVPAQSPVPVL